MENKLRHIVDVRDVAESLLLAYEMSKAEGRYICTAHAIKTKDLVQKLKSIYPNYNYPKRHVSCCTIYLKERIVFVLFYFDSLGGSSCI